jgi:hypothetical protein
MEKSKKVSHNNKEYCIFTLKYKNKSVPVLLDWKDYNIVKNLNKKWYINENGSVVCQHKINNKCYDLYLHEIVMSLKTKDDGLQKKTRSILHINRLGIDNRRENLQYDSIDKETNKNLKKKSRIITLPKETGISVDELPTFVWYLKPDKSHGERFFINIGETNWKTSSSSKLSLRYKLEEAKKFLRDLKTFRPEIFEEYSMNGELTKDGKLLLTSFYNITKKSGFTQLKNILFTDITDKYLKPKYNSLSSEEKLMLKNKSFF